MALLVAGNMRDHIEQSLGLYIDRIKIRTKSNLNSDTVEAEGFFRNFLNLVYGFNLNRETIANPNNDTIDLHSTESKICVQVSANNTKQKIKNTVDLFIRKEKQKIYRELHFVILDRERAFNYDENELLPHGVKIIFHDQSSIFSKLLNDFDSREKIEPIYNFIKSSFEEDYQINSETLLVIDRNEIYPDKLKELHIVEQIYAVLNQFDGFNTIYPRTIAKLFPFNSSKQNYDVYSHYCLKTDNIEIHELLLKISINDNNEVVLSEESLFPYKTKIEEIFKKLNNSLIRCICYREQYTEIKHHNINTIYYDDNCNCNSCKYQKFRIKDLFSLIKSKSINPSEELLISMNDGYYMAKAGEHLKSYKIFKDIESESAIKGKHILNYIANHNLKKIRNFIDSPWWQDEREQIIPEIDKIDLHERLIAYNISKDARDELTNIKENYYLHYSREIIEGYVREIVEIYNLYKHDGTRSGANIATLLSEELYILHCFYVSNSILIDDFYSFIETISKGVEGIFISYATDESYQDRYKSFDHLILLFMIFYIDEKRMNSIFNQYKIQSLNISAKHKARLLNTISNFFESQVSVTAFGKTEYNSDLEKQEYFSLYRQNLRHYFNRVMLILSKVKLDSNLESIAQPIIDYLSGTKDISHSNFEYFTIFFHNKVSIFSNKQLEKLFELLFINLEGVINNRDLREICFTASKGSKFEISNKFLFQKIYNSVLQRFNDSTRRSEKDHLISLYIISDEEGKLLTKSKSVEYLNSEFDSNFYQLACFCDVFTKKEFPKFLNQFLDYAERECSSFNYKEEGGKWEIISFTGINSLSCLNHLRVNFSNPKIQAISKKSDYYNWVINPKKFDYSKFNLSWLKSMPPRFIMEKINEIKPLKNYIIKQLELNYDRDLAKLLFLNKNRSTR